MTKKLNPKDEKIIELTADLQRVHAEFVNFKNRSEREKKEAISLGKESAIEDLLPVVDTLYLALDHVPNNLVDNPWVKGVVGLNKQLASSLKSIGLERIETVGCLFNPETMDAVSSEDGEGEKIVSLEIRPGYKYSGKVIRPAMVQVKNG